MARRGWARGVPVTLALTLAVSWGLVRRAQHHRIPRPPPEVFAQARRVEILRDTWGIPHVAGRTDPDAAFGLAWAHAEDDWSTIQDVLAASTGRLGLLHLSKTALLADWLAGFIGSRELADAQWPLLSQQTRDLLDGYANGLALYAFLHPAEADARLLPFTGRDILAGFIYKMPLLLGVPDVLAKLRARTPRAGEALPRGGVSEGSNAHALSAFRSADGITRLNVNSHQPWEGPVAWYEAQVSSAEGWNMTGGLFPGSPVVLHGFNDHLGWAHTVNSPALVDAYELEGDSEAFVLDGRREPFVKRRFPLRTELGLLELSIPLTFRDAAQGPVFEKGGRRYAIRYAGRERSGLSVEEWYRMNRASSLAELKAALALQAIPMFNVVFATGDGHIGYLYNALLPLREEPGAPAGTVLAGNRRAAIWTRYRPFDELPHLDDPASGFVQSCNTTPFAATRGAANPDPTRFAPADGIERTMNNRGLRSLELFGGGRKLSRDDFIRAKFDRTWAPESPLGRALDALAPGDGPPHALELLRSWNRVADESSPAAALAVLMEPRLSQGPQQALQHAAQFLEREFGRRDVPLGELQRLRRGAVDLPLGGGPDVLNAAETRVDRGRLVGRQGDSLVLIVDLTRSGTSGLGIVQYGASNRPGSPHYADQAPLFVRRELRPVWRTPEELRAHLERRSSPGDAPSQ